MAATIRAQMLDDWILPAVVAATGIKGAVRERPADYSQLPYVATTQGAQAHPFAWVYLNPDLPVEGAETFLSGDVLSPTGVTIEIAYRIENQWADSDIESAGETLAAAVHRSIMDDVQNDAANLPAGFVTIDLVTEPTIEPAPTDGFAVATLNFSVLISRSYFDLNQTRAA